MRKDTRVIVVTDGDETAWRAIRTASRDLGLHPLRASAGNPTPVDGATLIEAIQRAPKEPVVVMVDDRGEAGTGAGEVALRQLLGAPGLNVLGVVAVASNTEPVSGVRPVYSVDRNADLISGAVDKTGHPDGTVLKGDTVDVLRRTEVPVIGLGDPGKMAGQDAAGRGAPATRAALAALLGRDAQKD